MKMENKVAVISGASTGIGRAVALGFAREGAKVVAIARSTDKLEKLAEEIHAEGGTVLPLTCDISDESQVKSTIKKITDEYGRIDALVTTASLLVTCPVIDCTVEDWDRLFATNCRGTFLICRELLPIMRSQGRGRIVIYSSGAAWGYKMHEVIYSATKGAQVAFARVLSKEEHENGILVNVIVPGRTRTPMNPEGEQDPEVHVETTLWLATLPDDGPTGRIWQLMEEIKK